MEKEHQICQQVHLFLKRKFTETSLDIHASLSQAYANKYIFFKKGNLQRLASR